jgi:uncharacterized protein YbbC (DUF1343 family)
VKLTRRHALVMLGGMVCCACSPSGRATPEAQPPTPTPTYVAAKRPATAVVQEATRQPTPDVARMPTPDQPRLSTPDAVAVLPGVDVLLRDRLDVLRGHSLGLVTNATGRTRDGRGTIDALHDTPEWQLKALFSPEHGIRGEAEAGQSVDSSVDSRTGLPIFSLYGNTTQPTPAMLRGLDALVYDVQDVGARTYTYTSTLLEVMQAAAAQKLLVVVLDRPDPVGGDQIEGNVLDPRFASFVGAAPIAMRYGMTIGELGRFFNGELGVGADLSVVPVQGWPRSMWFDQTGLSWVNPSPNLRSLNAAALYPGMVLFEGTNLSEGRGTEQPFEWVGAPFIDGAAWADALAGESLPGVRVTPADRTPNSSKFAGQVCHGLAIEILDRPQLQPMALGVTLLASALAIAGNRVQLNASTFDGLAGTDQLRNALAAGRPAEEIVQAWQPELKRFRAIRERYLLY